MLPVITATNQIVLLNFYTRIKTLPADYVDVERFINERLPTNRAVVQEAWDLFFRADRSIPPSPTTAIWPV